MASHDNQLSLLLNDCNCSMQEVRKHIRKWQLHEINAERVIYGEYHHLFPILRRYPTKFKEYTRMKIGTFDYLLFKAEDLLTKDWCNLHQQPIIPEERLVLTLRYVEFFIHLFYCACFVINIGYKTLYWYSFQIPRNWSFV